MRAILYSSFLFWHLVTCSLLVYSQEKPKELEDYKNKVNQAKNNDEKAKALINLASFLSNKDTAQMMVHLREAYELSKKLDKSLYIADCYTYYGFYHAERNEFKRAETYYDKAIKIYNQEGDIKNLGNTYGQKGFLYIKTGEYNKALSSQLKSLEYKERLSEPQEQAVTLNNIGNIYIYMNEYKKAKSYYTQSMNKRIEAKDSLNMFHSYHNLGIVYKSLNQYDSALYFYGLAKENLDIQGRVGASAQVTESIGALYHEMGDYSKALEAFIEAESVYQRLNDQIGLAYINAAIGTNYKQMEDYNKAIHYLEKGVIQAQELKESRLLLDALKSLSESYGLSNNFKRAYHLLQEQNVLKDSVFKEERSKQIAEMETKYETEKKEVENQKLKIEKQLKEEELLASQKTQRLLIIVLLLAGGIVLVVYVMLRKIKKKNLEITEKKEQVEQKNIEISAQKEKVEIAHAELEEKNKEIMDSINYAKRIQTAILPPDKLVKEYLDNSFILYKPKDIVAGDFYWMEPRDGKLFFAAADCTGHGVPGAMVSVVCNNGLNRSVREYGYTDPGKILDNTRQLVIKEFEKSEEEVKDGMDIALCALKGKTLEYAGAHNPLWIIRKGAEEVEEIKADKQPIGKYDHPKPHTTHKIELNEGDSFYVFSDGFADQFGGEKGKKFKSMNFKRLLLSIREASMEQQKELINEAFENWKGDLEQLDDVCVIGVRV